jgi:ribosome-associated translation inhibitor RaiA
VVTWGRVGAQQGAVEVRCRIEHGLVVEQWIGPSAPAQEAAELGDKAGYQPRTVVTHGRVDDELVDYASKRLGRVIDQIAEPVWFVRIKLHLAPDPGRKRPALAQVTLDVDGDPVRAHVAASDMREAIDLLQRRLRDQLEHRAQRRLTLHRSGGIGRPGEWRHGQLRGRRPEYLVRPAGERELVRHKMFAIDEMTPEEAAFDMDQLDYEFFLFRDLASGEDALLRRQPDGSLLLTRLRPAGFEDRPVAMTVTVGAGTPSTLTVDEAIETLNAGHQPCVFFANTTTGRGNVVYRRYDGHYGVITPE